MLDQLTQAENTVKNIQDFLNAAAEEKIIQTLEKGKFPCNLAHASHRAGINSLASGGDLR